MSLNNIFLDRTYGCRGTCGKYHCHHSRSDRIVHPPVGTSLHAPLQHPHSISRCHTFSTDYGGHDGRLFNAIPLRFHASEETACAPHGERARIPALCSVRRLILTHPLQITSEEQQLHIAAADGAPGFDHLARTIAAEFSIPGFMPSVSAVDDWNGDWDAVYPLSHVSTRSNEWARSLTLMIPISSMPVLDDVQVRYPREARASRCH